MKEIILAAMLMITLMNMKYVYTNTDHISFILVIKKFMIGLRNLVNGQHINIK